MVYVSYEGFFLYMFPLGLMGFFTVLFEVLYFSRFFFPRHGFSTVSFP